MKKQSIKGLAFVVVAGTVVSSCTMLKDLDYTVTPDPLEMHGDSVRVKVDVVVPEKGINKKASAEITPMLGNTALKPVTIQGEKATGNGTVIAKAGGKITYTDVVAYKPEFENADLMVTGKISKGGKEKGTIDPAVKIADATIITPFMVNKDFKVIIANDEFQRVTEETFSAQLNYAKGKSNVTTKEMKEDDIKAFQEWLAEAQANAKIDLKNVKIVGFASPEGEVDKNSNLSSDRAGSAKESTVSLGKKAENEKAQGEIYNLSGSGEDYPGFKKALEADTKMNEDDKNLVLRVLEMYKDPNEREQAMRDLGKTFTYLDKNIFPGLRRSEITAVYDLTGFSDEEMKNYSVSKPDTMDLEELLFCATLYDDLNEKLRVYKIAEERYGDKDYRPANNVGAVLYMQNKMSEAKAKFEKANGVQDNPISKNNLGAIAGVEGDRSKSWGLLNQAGGAEETKYNKGILHIQDGRYADAVSNLGSDASFNKALAEMLNGSASTAVSTVDNTSADKESAQGYYLKAIAAARQDVIADVVSNLKNAIAKDGSYKGKAAKDREFIKYFENPSFTAIVK